MKKFIICDLDGTIALNKHRQYLVNNENFQSGQKKDWTEFTARSSFDLPNWPVINILQKFKDDRRIVILSGRANTVRDQTIDWLNYFYVPFDQLIMRSVDDHRNDRDIKPEMLMTVTGLLHFDEIDFFIDDRQSVVDRWREMGFTVFQVAPGKF